MPALSIQDIKWYYSTHVGTEDDIPYLGGPRSPDTELSDNILHNLFDKTNEDQQETGITKYACFYIFNDSETDYIKNPILFVISDTVSPSDYVEVGWGSARIGSGLSGALDESIEQTLDNQHQQPQLVSFFKGHNRNEGAILNADIPPQKAKAAWVRLYSVLNAQDFIKNHFKLRLVADNLYNDVPEPTGTTAPEEAEFCILGECSGTPDFMKIIKAMFARASDFWVTVGNNNLELNPSFFIGAIQNYVQRLLIGCGNVDCSNLSVNNYYRNATSQYRFSGFGAKRFYSKEYGNIHLLQMDASGLQSYIPGSEQFKFIKKDLELANQNRNIDWIFVFSNRAMYGSQTTSETRFLFPDLRDTYHELFTENNVLALFQGSFHWYERTKVLQYNEDTPANPVAFDYDYSEDPESENYHKYTIEGRKSFPDGFLAFTTGTGGSSHDIATSIAPYSNKIIDQFYGFPYVKVENKNDTKKLKIRFNATSGLKTEVADFLEIERVG